MRLLQKAFCLAAAVFFLASAAYGDTITLVANRDTTIYEDTPGNSDGAGRGMITGNSGTGSPRRALLGFDVAGNVPAGATINSVQLTLFLARSSLGESAPRLISLRTVLADWGEGTTGMGASVSQIGQGFFTPADGTTATWSHSFYDASPWANAGGDFSEVDSASTLVGTSLNSPYTWDSTDQLVSDVQGWLDTPESNFGWLLLGDESVSSTGRVFHTREALNPSLWPSLVIDYTPPAGP